MEPLLLTQLGNAGGSSQLVRLSIMEPPPMQQDNTPSQFQNRRIGAARTRSILRASQLRASWTSFAYISNSSAILWTCTYASSKVELGIRAKKGFAKQLNWKTVQMQRKRRPPLVNNHATKPRNQAICSCSLPRQNSANVARMVRMKAVEKKTPKKRSPTSLTSQLLACLVQLVPLLCNSFSPKAYP